MSDAARQLPWFGEGARFHHVGLAMRSIRDACGDAETRVNETEGVSLAFVEVHGIRIELLEPLGEDSPIARNLANGVKLLHLCFEVPDLDAALEHCRPAGFHRLKPPAPAAAMGGRRIVWVFHREFGLFELLEREPR